MRFLARFFFFAALLALASPARAQSVTGIGTPVASDGDLLYQHPSGIGINNVNFADCNGDQHIKFVIAYSGTFTTYQLEVWAGSQDCTATTARSGASPTCWPVYPAVLHPQQATPISIAVRDIISQITASQKTVIYNGEAAQGVCNSAQTSTTGQTVSLYFFLTDGAETDPVIGSAVKYDTKIDTKASPVSGTITSSVGDTALFLNIPTTTDPDTSSWIAYCDPPSNGRTAPVPDAAATVVTPTTCDGGVDATATTDAATGDDGGDAGDASDDGASTGTGTGSGSGGCSSGGGSGGSSGGSTSSSCPSAYVVPGGGTVSGSDEAGTTTVTGGTQVILPGVFQCGTASVSSTTITISGLVNGTTYTVAVAAVDKVGNIGPLSNVECDSNTTPTQVNDFWADYTKAGGNAGGGYCALDGVGMPAGSLVFGVGMVAAAAAMARRRRRS
jgi:hypothetical protein